MTCHGYFPLISQAMVDCFAGTDAIHQWRWQEENNQGFAVGRAPACYCLQTDGSVENT